MSGTRSRIDLLFDLRYAQRVLERAGRFWGRVDAILRITAILSGSIAVAALVGEHTQAAKISAIVFALLQAIEFGIDPAKRTAEINASARLYAKLGGKEGRLSDSELAEAIAEARAEDHVTVFDTLRELAYNDVVQEQGFDPKQCFGVPFRRRLALLLA